MIEIKKWLPAFILVCSVDDAAYVVAYIIPDQTRSRRCNGMTALMQITVFKDSSMENSQGTLHKSQDSASGRDHDCYLNGTIEMNVMLCQNIAQTVYL